MAEVDVVNFFSRSSDKPPGKGASEHVSDSEPYRELAAIPDWRRILSNFAVAPFVLDGRHYRTAEHAYHAKKFEPWYPELAREFSLESGSELSRGGGLEARAARKLKTLYPQQLAEWVERRPRELARIYEAKFTQSPQARRVLLATRDAELWHRAPRSQPEHWVELERLRARLRGADQPPDLASEGAREVPRAASPRTGESLQAFGPGVGRFAPNLQEEFLREATAGHLSELKILRERPGDFDYRRAFELAAVNNRFHAAVWLADLAEGLLGGDDIRQIREALLAKGNSAGARWLDRRFPRFAPKPTSSPPDRAGYPQSEKKQLAPHPAHDQSGGAQGEAEALLERASGNAELSGREAVEPIEKMRKEEREGKGSTAF